MLVCYIRCAQIHISFLLWIGWGQLSVPDFEKGGSEKNVSREGLGLGLKSSCHKYLPGGLTVPFQKRLRKIKYGFEG